MAQELRVPVSTLVQPIAFPSADPWEHLSSVYVGFASTTGDEPNALASQLAGESITGPLAIVRYTPASAGGPSALRSATLTSQDRSSATLARPRSAISSPRSPPGPPPMRRSARRSSATASSAHAAMWAALTSQADAPGLSRARRLLDRQGDQDRGYAASAARACMILPRLGRSRLRLADWLDWLSGMYRIDGRSYTRNWATSWRYGMRRATWC